MAKGYAGDLLPLKAWEILEREPSSRLIDVRTRAEWQWVGTADLTRLGKEVVYVSWQVFPSMNVNEDFVGQLVTAAPDRDATMLFICRSGYRSAAAAQVATRIGYRHSYNVATGFEGDKDEDRHRGTVCGWKVSGLPWTQG